MLRNGKEAGPALRVERVSCLPLAVKTAERLARGSNSEDVLPGNWNPVRLWPGCHQHSAPKATRLLTLAYDKAKAMSTVKPGEVPSSIMCHHQNTAQNTKAQKLVGSQGLAYMPNVTLTLDSEF